jgi:hypothetical protein
MLDDWLSREHRCSEGLRLEGRQSVFIAACRGSLCGRRAFTSGALRSSVPAPLPPFGLPRKQRPIAMLNGPSLARIFWCSLGAWRRAA